MKCKNKLVMATHLMSIGKWDDFYKHFECIIWIKNAIQFKSTF